MTESVRVNIFTLDISKLTDKVPSNYSITVAVQCLSEGLSFKKPVKLIFILPETEIPGTTVRLALYSASQDMFLPTGRTSPVAVDGHTLNFTIAHFSNYAGLKSLLSQGAPIGAGVEIPLPDLYTGAFSHSISLTVPPGRKNLQPNLSIQYRSSNPNSWLGLGWNLNPGYIVRSTKAGPPTYDDKKDRFLFITDAGSTELVWLVDNLYQAKIESTFAKFFKQEDDSWKVVQKDGTILLFGTTSDSKETSDSGTFLWNLTKILDTNGNYIQLNYTKDGGKSYLSSIEYTGNENTNTSPLNRIEFELEDRDNVRTSYISISKITTAKRLKEIRVLQQDSLVWRYKLEYEYSPDTSRSLLKSITQYSADGKSFPTKTFTYQRAKQ